MTVRIIPGAIPHTYSDTFGITSGGLTIRIWRDDVELSDEEARQALQSLMNVVGVSTGLAGLIAGIGGTLLIQRIAK